MIVDDNTEMRRLIATIASSPGDTICEFEDGSSAVDAYPKQLPDLVLMDIEMPRMDGLNATKAICSAYPDARVVIVTQASDTLTKKAASDAGACGFVSKSNLSELHTYLDLNTELS